MATDPWQNIPLDVLDDQRRADRAAAWGRARRAELAADWAKLQFDDLALLEQQYPALPEPDNGVKLGGMVTESATAPFDEQRPFGGGFEQAGSQSFDPLVGKLTTFQGSSGRMLDEGPYPGSLPTPGFDPNAGYRVPVEQEQDLIDRQYPDQPPMPPFTRLNLPGLPGMALPIAPVVPRPVPPSEEEQERVVEGRPFTPETAVTELGKFLGQQGGQQQPAGVMDVVFPEEQAGRFVRRADELMGGTTRISPVFGAETIAQRAGEAAEEAPGLVEKGKQAARRFFHGTGAAFDRPDAARFDPDGLFGPGYYLTSDPRVAGSYAEKRAPGFEEGWSTLQADIQTLRDVIAGRGQWNPEKAGRLERIALESQRKAAEQRLPELERRLAEMAQGITAGPNIRPVDVPEGLNLLDADAPVNPDVFERVARYFERRGNAGAAANYRADALRARGAPTADRPGAPRTGEEFYRDLSADLDDGTSRARGINTGMDLANRALTELGYDGIKYAGGKRVPMADDAGAPIEHEAVVIFPESMARLRNAISGTPYGAAAGLEVDEEGNVGFSPEKAALGAVGGAVAGRLAKKKPPGAATAKIAAQEAERLRLDKFPEAVRDVVQTAAEQGDFWRTQRRGVIPDAEAEEMADRLGRTVDQMIARSGVGKAYNTEETRAVRNALVSQSMKVADLALGAAASPTKMTREAVASLIAEGTKLADLSRIAEGARAEAGRTLRAYQAYARDYAQDPAGAVMRIYKATAGDEAAALTRVDEFAKLVQSGADPFQMAGFWSKVEKPPVKAEDWFRAIRYNSMLSGPRTMLVNLAGLSEVPWKLGRDVGASALSGDLRPIRPEVQGVLAGTVKGLRAAGQVLAHGISREAAERGDLPRSLSSRLDNPLAKGAATALELPSRGMGAIDELLKQIGYGMAKGRSAGIKASKEGLSGDAWLKRVDELVAEQDKESVEGALAVAERMTYKGPMGFLGEDVLVPAQKWSPMGVPLGNIVIPFLRSVYHITSRGIDRSPLGLVGTAADVLKGTYKAPGGVKEALSKTDTEGLPKGVVPLGERLGDNLMGAVAFGALSLYAAEGNITGKGPEDKNKRDLMVAQGWQPYSIRVGDQWVSYANWGPAAVPFSFAAALAEGEGEGPEWAYDVFTRGAGVLTEQSYLQGIGNIFKVLDQRAGGTYGEKTAEGLMGSVVPYGSAINTVGQATDPLVRAPEKGDLIGGGIESRLPGVREGLPAKQDVLGRDVENPQRGLAAAVPLRTSPVKQDSVVRALLDAGVDVPEPPKDVSHENVKGIPLTEADRREYRRIAGEELSRAVQRMVANPKWENGTQAQRAEVLQQALDQAREKAKVAVLKNLGRDEIKRRLAATPVPAVAGAGARP